MPLQTIAKLLIGLGAALALVGAILLLGGRFGLGNFLGHLPGDLEWKRGSTSIYFPVVTSIILSILLTVVLNLLLRFFR